MLDGIIIETLWIIFITGFTVFLHSEMSNVPIFKYSISLQSIITLILNTSKYVFHLFFSSFMTGL